ncbi:enterobactin/ferric enterobactin esterase [compost metagenome]
MANMQVEFYSKSLKRQVSFSALLPIERLEPPTPERRGLKSLYLLHGYAGSHTDWLYFTRIRELSEKYNIAVFMPSGENHFYLDDEDKEERHGEFIGHELVELTRSLFPLSREREDTFIGGLSMGGFGAIRNGLKYNGSFGRIIALSSALILHGIAGIGPDFHNGIAGYAYYRRVFGDLNSLLGSDKDPEALVKELKTAGADLPQIYMACGTDDFLLKENRLFHVFLAGERVAHTYKESPGAHNWDFWNTHIAEALEWAAGR